MQSVNGVSVNAANGVFLAACLASEVLANDQAKNGVFISHTIAMSYKSVILK
jgi:hypothetical protein